MNDYIVLVDENGQPYIAHGIWSKARDAANSGRKKATKYIEKIGEGAKARYFYTKEELDAYYNKGKQKAKQTVDKAKQKAKDWSGVTAREKRDAAASDYKNATDKQRMARLKAAKSANRAGRLNEQYKEAQEQANSAIKDASIANYKYNSATQWRDSAKKNYDEAKNRGGVAKVLDKTLAGIAGVKTIEESTYDSFRRASAQAADRKLEAESANRKAEAAKDKRSEMRAKTEKEFAQNAVDERAKMQADKDYDAAESAYKKAAAEYGNTPLGRIEAAKEKFANAKETAKAYASDKLGDISKGFNSAKDKAKNAVDSAKEKAGKAVDKVKEKAKDKLGYDERERRDAANKAYEDNEKRFSSEVDERKARQAYKELTSYADKMNERYGDDWQNKMSPTEQKKYAGLVKKDNEASEAWHDVIKNRYSHAWGSPDTLKDKKNKADADYYNTPLGRLESFKEDASEAADKVKGVASSAANKVKGAADSAADKAKGAASSVKSSYDRMKEEFAESKAKKEADKAIKKASSDFKDFKKKYKSPDPNIFTYDKSTGQTVNTKQKFDFYAGKAEDIYSYLNSHPYIRVDDKQRLLDDAQDYLDMAKNYAQQKK